MDTKALKQIIDGWFYDNRPEFQPTDEFIENVYKEIKDEVIDLDRDAMYIIVSEYLRLNYGNITYDIIQEVLSEDEFEEYRKKINDTIPFIAQGEREAIVKEVAKERIVEKYGSSHNELIDNQPLYEEIRTILRKRDKEWEVTES